MNKLTENELIIEIEKMYVLINKYSVQFLDKYSRLDENIKSYVYAKSRPIHRGYYNPTIAAHVAIGGNQKGPKPRIKPPSDVDEYVVFGLDEFDRPIFVQTMFSNNRKANSFEIVSYFDDLIIGITFENNHYMSIHESKFDNGVIKKITSCSFGLIENTDLHDCHRIEIEVFEYDKPNHFIWSLTWYNPNWKKIITEQSAKLLKIDKTLPLIQNMEYEFDVDNDGKLLRMYNDYDVKLFKHNIQKTKTKKKNKIYLVADSIKVFNEMLIVSNISIDNFNLIDFSMLVRNFMDIKFNCAEDSMLFETGVFNSDFGEDVFIIDFSRQFKINDIDDIFDHFEQTHITIHLENSHRLEITNKSCWSMNFGSIDDFFSYVFSSKDLLDVISDSKILSISVHHCNV